MLFPEHVFLRGYGGTHRFVFIRMLGGSVHALVECVYRSAKNGTRGVLGYDTRLYKLGIFTLGAGIAAVGGVLFANGVGQVTPDIFNLYNSALTIIWVIVGGRGTLIGPIAGAFALFYLTASLGAQTVFNNNLVLGLILVIFVLVVPKGLYPRSRVGSTHDEVAKRCAPASAGSVCGVHDLAPRQVPRRMRDEPRRSCTGDAQFIHALWRRACC